MIKLKTLMFEATGMTVYLLFGYPESDSNSAQVMGVYASDMEAKKLGELSREAMSFLRLWDSLWKYSLGSI